MSLIIRRLNVAEFSVNVPVFVDIYLAAMQYSQAIRDTRINVWRRNSQNRNFVAVCAQRGDRVLGVAYGFAGDQDHWWQHQLRRGLREKGGPSSAELLMLKNYFEVAEVHVLPAYQGKGIGRELVVELLSHAHATRAILSTPEVAAESNFAFSLYRSLGFSDLLRNFHFDGDDREFAVLTTTLPLSGCTTEN